MIAATRLGRKSGCRASDLTNSLSQSLDRHPADVRLYTRMVKRRIITLISFIVILIAASVPFPTVVVPRWRVQVVDINESPCVKQTVSQSWAHYSLSDDSHTDYQKTDVDGFVSFPERTISKNLLQRIVYPIIAYALLLAHGSAGIDAYIYAGEPVNAGVFGLKYDWTEPLPNKLIVKRCFVDHDIPDK